MLWDDDRHVTRSDLRSTEGLWRIWFDLGATQQYYPVAHTAFWIQHRLWGDATLGYHLVNIVLHGSSAFLIGLILRRLAAPGAWLAAAIFALHPVHVESVAWISELKNTLSGVLYLGAALVYLKFDAGRERQAYVLALGLFLLALFAKTATATLPAALLVVFWWQRGRLEWSRDVRPLAPFLAAGVAAGLFTAWVERTLIGAEGADFELTAIERVLVAGRAVWFYLGTLVWPANLTFIYPRWNVDQSAWWQYLFPLTALAVLAGCWRWRSRSRAPLAAALLFGGTLVPALGFFNVFPFRYSFVADHFVYLASIPVITLASAGLARAAARRTAVPRVAMVAAAVALAGGLGALTWAQSRDYADAETLYRATLRRNPGSWMAHNNLGRLLVDAGRMDEARVHLEESLRLRGDLPEPHFSLGLLELRQARLAEAAGRFETAVRLDPGFAEARNNLGLAWLRLGRAADALGAFDEARRLDPGLAPAHKNACEALVELGRPADAFVACEEALGLDPEYPEAHHQLGIALFGLGRLDEAVAEYERALRSRSDLAQAHSDLGVALLQLGRQPDAVAHFEEAVRLEPRLVNARFNLGNVFVSDGRLDDAVAQYTAALDVAPDDAVIHHNLGVALEELGRLGEAAAQYEEALRLRPDFAQARESLARVKARLVANR